MMLNQRIPSLFLRRNHLLPTSTQKLCHSNPSFVLRRQLVTLARLSRTKPCPILFAGNGRVTSLNRFFSTTTTAVIKENVLTQSQPPLFVRTALVATTTAIGTPAFPVVGFVNLGLRYFVWDSQVRYSILGATSVLGAIGTLVQLAAFDLLPVAYSYGQLFLPFAVVNGGLAATAYLALDVTLGTSTVASLPYAGAAMGAFVGFMGPVSGLYDTSFQYFYDMPEVAGWFTYLLKNAVMLPISITSGAAIGFMMHPLLYYPIVGVQGWHWAKFSAPILAGACAMLGHLYYSDYFDSDFYPPETYLTREEKLGLVLVPRFHAKELQLLDWGQKIGYYREGTGAKAREQILRKLEATKYGTAQFNKVFDSRRKAWLHYVTGGMFGTGLAIDACPSQADIDQNSQQFISSDGAVTFVLLQGNDSQESITLARETLAQFMNDRKAPSKFNRGSPESQVEAIQRMELASLGISLLLTELLEAANEKQRQASPKAAKRMRKLESHIRNLVPDIILFCDEEMEGTYGSSVESQLKQFGWKGIANSKQGRLISEQWKCGLAQEQSQTKKRQLSWAITGLTMVLLYGLFGGK